MLLSILKRCLVFSTLGKILVKIFRNILGNNFRKNSGTLLNHHPGIPFRIPPPAAAVERVSRLPPPHLQPELRFEHAAVRLASRNRPKVEGSHRDPRSPQDTLGLEVGERVVSLGRRKAGLRLKYIYLTKSNLEVNYRDACSVRYQ